MQGLYPPEGNGLAHEASQAFHLGGTGFQGPLTGQDCKKQSQCVEGIHVSTVGLPHKLQLVACHGFGKPTLLNFAGWRSSQRQQGGPGLDVNPATTKVRERNSRLSKSGWSALRDLTW